MAAGIQASRNAAIEPTPLQLAGAVSPQADAMPGAIDAKLWQEPGTVTQVAAIITCPLRIARAISERTYCVSAAVAGTGIGQRAFRTMPA